MIVEIKSISQASKSPYFSPDFSLFPVLTWSSYRRQYLILQVKTGPIILCRFIEIRSKKFVLHRNPAMRTFPGMRLGSFTSKINFSTTSLGSAFIWSRRAGDRPFEQLATPHWSWKRPCCLHGSSGESYSLLFFYFRQFGLKIMFNWKTVPVWFLYIYAWIIFLCTTNVW